MKKSKKILLWSILPVLGISGGVAGVAAGVKNHNTSTNINSTVALNSATSLTRSKTINEIESNLKIIDQTYDVLVNSDDDLGDELFVEVDDSELDYSIDLTYNWYVNKGNGWYLYATDTSSSNRSELTVTIEEEVSLMETWTFRCIVTDNESHETTTSEDIKFTITPWEGSYIQIAEQPIRKQEFGGGQEVTLNVKANFVGVLEKDKVYYRWFEYDSENDKFTPIDGATESTYTFTTPFISKTQTRKYVCRFYLKSDFGNYISESNQAIVTINKSEPGTKPTETLSVTSSVKSNQASVRNNFHSNSRISGAWYEVDVKDKKSNEKLVYEWYYVGRNGKEHLIEGTNNSNKLTPNKKLFESVYKDNSNHRVSIICKIYKDGKLDTIVNEKTNSRFYLNVVTNNRVVRVSK